MTPPRSRFRPKRQIEGASLRSYWANAVWALSLLWNTDRLLLAGVMGTVAVQSILPAGQALVSRELINVVVAVLKTGGQPTQNSVDLGRGRHVAGDPPGGRRCGE